MKFVPGTMEQNRFRSILSHYSQDKISSMKQIFIMFHRGSPLWKKFVRKKGTMTGFSGGSIKRDVCYCYLSFSTAIN